MVLPRPSWPVNYDHPFTALLYVSRQVYGLAIESLYRQNSFVFPEAYPGGHHYPMGHPPTEINPLGLRELGRRARHGTFVRPIHQMARFRLGILPERTKDIRNIELQLWNPPSVADVRARRRFQ